MIFFPRFNPLITNIHTSTTSLHYPQLLPKYGKQKLNLSWALSRCMYDAEMKTVPAETQRKWSWPKKKKKIICYWNLAFFTSFLIVYFLYFFWARALGGGVCSNYQFTLRLVRINIYSTSACWRYVCIFFFSSNYCLKNTLGHLLHRTHIWFSLFFARDWILWVEKRKKRNPNENKMSKTTSTLLELRCN